LTEKSTADLFEATEFPFVAIVISTPLCGQREKSAVAHQEILSRVTGEMSVVTEQEAVSRVAERKKERGRLERVAHMVT
jgi:hypothetical protein